MLTSLLLSIALSSQGAATRAPSSSDGLPGWQRSRWSVQDGAPPSIESIAQTSDGYLLFGSSEGLFRFDGVTFVRIPSAVDARIQADQIHSVVVSPKHGVLAGHDWGGVSTVRADRQIMFPGSEAMKSTYRLKVARDGTVWAFSASSGFGYVYRLSDAQWTKTATLSRAIAGYIKIFKFGPDGTFWFMTDKLGYVLPGSPDIHWIDRALAPSSEFVGTTDGSIWIGQKSAGGDVRTGPAITGPFGTVGTLLLPAGRQAGSFLLDNSTGLWETELNGAVSHYEPGPAGRWVKTGTSPSTTAISPEPAGGVIHPSFIDSEGSLWIATRNGVEQFRTAPFHKVPEPVTGAGSGFRLLKDGKGDLWLRRGDGLFRIGADGASTLFARGLSTSEACSSHFGGVWASTSPGHYELYGSDRRARYLYEINGVTSAYYVVACVEDSAGRLWISDIYNGLSILDASGLHPQNLGSDTKFPPTELAADDRGRVSAYIGRGNLWRTDGHRPELLATPEQLPLGFSETLMQGPRNLFLGGDEGIVRFDGRHPALLSRKRLPILSHVAGILPLVRGDTWVQAAAGILKFKTADLDRAFVDPSYTPPFRLFTFRDGIPGVPTYSYVQSMQLDRQGRLWAVTSNGVTWVDTRAQARTETLAAAITDVSADGRSIAHGNRIDIPKNAARFEVHFRARTLIDTLGVVFRYRMKSLDDAWVDAGKVRSASYMALPPGTYRFEVQASRDGTWNGPVTGIGVTVPALFYQTSWFKFLCGGLFLLTVWLIYRIRLAALAQRLRAQMEGRIHERERIARELHDTLLQSVHALLLRFRIVTDTLPGDSPAREQLDGAISLAENTVAEGRRRVIALRGGREPDDIQAAIWRKIDGALFDEAVSVQVRVHGAPKRLAQPSMADIEHIVGEALFNAARHAEARNVVVTATFERKRLGIEIRDDGRGLPLDVQEAGHRPGHFGLLGMRERAALLGARLMIRSAEGGGTAISLSVPGRIAYRRRQPPTATNGEGDTAQDDRKTVENLTVSGIYEQP